MSTTYALGWLMLNGLVSCWGRIAYRACSKSAVFWLGHVIDLVTHCLADQFIHAHVCNGFDSLSGNPYFVHFFSVYVMHVAINR